MLCWAFNAYLEDHIHDGQNDEDDAYDDPGYGDDGERNPAIRTSQASDDLYWQEQQQGNQGNVDENLQYIICSIFFIYRYKNVILLQWWDTVCWKQTVKSGSSVFQVRSASQNGSGQNQKEPLGLFLVVIIGNTFSLNRSDVNYCVFKHKNCHALKQHVLWSF